MSRHIQQQVPILRLPAPVPRQVRKLVRLAIEKHMAATDALIAFIDEADGDTDLGTDDEHEADVADEPHDAECEFEPSLAQATGNVRCYTLALHGRKNWVQPCGRCALRIPATRGVIFDQRPCRRCRPQCHQFGR